MSTKNALRREALYRSYRGRGPTDWEACARFLEAEWRIQHPEKGAILFKLRDAQRETLQVWLTERKSVVLKARQIGFTTLAAGMAYWLCLFHPDRRIIMLSKTERDAFKNLGKGRYGYQRLPQWLRDRLPKLTTDTQGKVEFVNGSGIESLPASEPARGDTAYMIIVDEWAFFEKPEEAWAAIEPAADVGGRVIALSTANGAGNLFHEMWVGATAGTNGFVPIFYAWDANADRGDDWYEGKKTSLPSWQLHQEYPSNPEEAFIRSGNPVFDPDVLANVEAVPHEVSGYFFELGSSVRNFEFRPEGGPLKVWKMPKPGHSYVIGADVAEGLEHGDFSSAHVIDVNTGEVAAVWHGRIDPDLFGKLLAQLGWWYRTALIGPEANNHGMATVKSLLRARYKRVYRRHTIGNRTEKQGSQMGWLTTARSKPLAIDGLVTAFREKDITLYDEHTLAELRTFVRDGDGKMHGSPFDDRVMSLAVAWQMVQWAHSPEQEADDVNDYMTLEWWERQGKQSSAPWVIGAGQAR